MQTFSYNYMHRVMQFHQKKKKMQFKQYNKLSKTKSIFEDYAYINIRNMLCSF